MKSRLPFLVLTLLFILSSCSSLPKREVMIEETATFNLPVTPKPDESMVYIVRPSGLGSLIRFNVFVDSQNDVAEIGYTRGMQHIYVALPPGKHEFHSKAENWASMNLECKAGKTYFIEQDPSMGFIMARNQLLELDDVTGKYHVMRTGLGTIYKNEMNAK